MPNTSKEEALYQRLLTGPNVAALAPNIYPVREPEGTPLPVIRFQRISSPTESQQAGPETDNPRFQISCWADDQDEARLLGEAVIKDLAGYRGTYGDRTITVLKLDEREDEDQNTHFFRRIVDVAVR